MIYTRFGTPVEIIYGEIDANDKLFSDHVLIKMNDETIETFVHLLKADGGIKEIENEIVKATRKYEDEAKEKVRK